MLAAWSAKNMLFGQLPIHIKCKIVTLNGLKLLILWKSNTFESRCVTPIRKKKAYRDLKIYKCMIQNDYLKLAYGMQVCWQ